MLNIALADSQERQTIFLNTASKLNVNPAIIEKDFWVCFILDFLFHKSKWKNNLAFKGGTSLSKAYNLIERFSEDIDLILDWRLLDYKINEPWEERSNTKQQAFIVESRTRLFSFLEKEFTPELKMEMEKLLNCTVNIFISDDDNGIVNFEYPSNFVDKSILRVIRLEIGALSAWSPTQPMEIEPYVAKCYPEIFDQQKTTIITVTPERTFWEKATILHQEAYRPIGSNVPARYSRHYYDIYCMANSQTKDNALKMPELLEQVAIFKAKFYPRGWARYDLARIGTIKLMPPEHSIQKLRRDYASMRSMIFGKYPSFDEILETIKALEMEINESITKV